MSRLPNLFDDIAINPGDNSPKEPLTKSLVAKSVFQSGYKFG